MSQNNDMYTDRYTIGWSLNPTNQTAPGVNHGISSYYTSNSVMYNANTSPYTYKANLNYYWSSKEAIMDGWYRASNNIPPYNG